MELFNHYTLDTMNGLLHMNRTARPLHRLVRLPFLCGLLCLVLVRAASGQQALYDNEGSVGPNPMTIDATNFLNNGTFTVDFISSAYLQLYETLDTLNYTNNGTMIGNNGFQFDTHSSSSGVHSMASTFNNPGTIRAGSAIDELFSVDGFPPEFVVSATNIVNSGTVVVGQNAIITGDSLGAKFTVLTSIEANGLLQFSGQNVDLSRSTLTVEGAGALDSVDSGVTGLTGNFGTDTNKDWIPSEELEPTFAESSEASPLAVIFPPNYFLSLPDSTPYYTTQAVGTNDVITRMVFIENYNPINYNVYIGPVVIGTGEATIEWVDSYVDSASGNTFNNYLYLNDDYALGSTTNVLLVNGVPDNFTFEESTVQIPIGTPLASAYPTGLIQPVGVIVTNTYSYADAQLIATSVGTNNVIAGLTNMPGRIQINASKELNLSLANFSGLNYMSLTASNQFDGTTGAQIAAPYADINIGVTNGYLTVSNLTESSLPQWSGTVQCWSGRWLALLTNMSVSVDPNTMVATTNTYTVTNDYRVLIVGTQIAPTTASQVQNLCLHGTNSVVISDAFSILGSLFIDTRNLTLTTNVLGAGAQSFEGELNLESAGLFWSNCVPNLRNLTNNGVIGLQNLAIFGSPQTNYYNFINTGSVVDQGGQVWADNFNSSGIFSNGVGSFALQSTNTVLAGGMLASGGNVSIATGSLLASNLVLQAGRSLTLTATNLLTDAGVNNGNIWSVGASAVGGQSELSLPVKPAAGDLLGTTISTIAPTNKNVIVTWAGKDYGVSNAGFTNNVAVGHLILDAFGTSPQNGQYTFNGTGVSNAIYVDELEFRDSATNDSSYNFPALSINTNLVIYFAQAYANGVSIAEKIDIASRFSGKNGGRLLWVPSYAGQFSSTNIVFPDGSTHAVNLALLQSKDIDSDGDGIPNYYDPTPFSSFISSQVGFTQVLTNVPPLSMQLSWLTIPDSANYLYYTTNLVSTNWFLLFQTNTSPYLSAPIPVSVLDPVSAQMRFYKVLVQPLP